MISNIVDKIYSINLFGVFQAFGLIISFIILCIRIRKYNKNFYAIYYTLMLMIIIALIFGRIGFEILYSIENNWHFYIFGGQSLLSSIIGLFLITPAFFKYIKIDWRINYHIILPVFFIDFFLGKIGCYFGGCCFGKHCDYFFAKSVVLMKVNENIILKDTIHPVQLYESLMFLISFFIITNIEIKNNQFIKTTYLFLFLYSMNRFIAEFFRGDNIHFIYGIPIPQIISILILFFSIYKLIKLKFF
jgi:phosphatidylglycerol:prolipoprotein diacylglycerol transferase